MYNVFWDDAKTGSNIGVKSFELTEKDAALKFADEMYDAGFKVYTDI
jgi:hypothetical protein